LDLVKGIQTPFALRTPCDYGGFVYPDKTGQQLKILAKVDSFVKGIQTTSPCLHLVITADSYPEKTGQELKLLAKTY